MKHTLSYENLDAYKVAVDVARWIRGTKFPCGDAALKDQARRAADSVVLRARQEPERRCPKGCPKGRSPDGTDNLAEGAYRQGKERAKHYRIARGSAAEACAVLDLVDLEGGAERQQQLRRVVAMTCKLRQPD